MTEIDISAIMAACPRRFKVAKPQEKPKADISSTTHGRIAGLGPMSRVTTVYGEYPAQTLRARDRVLTKSGEFIPIKSVDRITFDEQYITYHPEAQPILIRAGALSQGVPAADTILAPHQRLHPVQSVKRINKKYAVEIIGGPCACRKTERMITYTVLGFERDTIIRCEGLWLEVDAVNAA